MSSDRVSAKTNPTIMNISLNTLLIREECCIFTDMIVTWYFVFEDS